MYSFSVSTTGGGRITVRIDALVFGSWISSLCNSSLVSSCISFRLIGGALHSSIGFFTINRSATAFSNALRQRL